MSALNINGRGYTVDVDPGTPILANAVARLTGKSVRELPFNYAI